MSLLTEAGLSVRTAQDGMEAIELARQMPFDLILMDMQMPGVNGEDATRAIRAGSVNARTPVLAMTANVFDEDRRRCLAAGMNGHLGKPIKADDLFDDSAARKVRRKIPVQSAGGARAPEEAAAVKPTSHEATRNSPRPVPRVAFDPRAESARMRQSR